MSIIFSDLQGMRTIAKRDGDDWILNGSKVFITNGWMAGVVIVCAVTNPKAKSPAHGLSLFLVEEGMPGFKKGSKLQKVGLKAQVRMRLLIQCKTCVPNIDVDFHILMIVKCISPFTLATDGAVRRRRKYDITICGLDDSIVHD